MKNFCYIKYLLLFFLLRLTLLLLNDLVLSFLCSKKLIEFVDNASESLDEVVDMDEDSNIVELVLVCRSTL